MTSKESTTIRDLQIIYPEVFRDNRGEYVETYARSKYNFKGENGIRIEFVEDDISVSRQHVLRGLHGDRNTWKLIQCLHGSFLFVVVDLRKQSATYLRSESFTLSETNRIQILVPAGCANGHLCLSEKCIFSYKQSEYYSGAQNQFTLRWDHPKLNLEWPISSPLLSARDRNAEFIEL
jgi:dTDP-4-dehydrorhamnose 3,5-epimerase